MLIRGTDLTPAQREQVKAAFIYRWTKDNEKRVQAYGPCPKCDIREPYCNPRSAEGHKHPTLKLGTDEEWLRSHAFHFTQDGGRLMHNRKYAEPILQGTVIDTQGEDGSRGQHGQDVLTRAGVPGRFDR